MYVKKLYITKMCNAISIVLLIGFTAKTIIDYTQYASTFGSAPFSVWIMANALYFIFPAVILFTVGIVCKIKK